MTSLRILVAVLLLLNQIDGRQETVEKGKNISQVTI